MPEKGQVGSARAGIRALHGGVVLAGMLMSIITMGLTEILAFLFLAMMPMLVAVRRPLLTGVLTLTLVATACADSAPPAATESVVPAATTSVPAPPPTPTPTLEPELPVAPEPHPEAVPVAYCEPSYPDVCIAPGPPDLNCPDVPHKDIRVLPPDPHGFDGRDNDGLGCEAT